MLQITAFSLPTNDHMWHACALEEWLPILLKVLHALSAEMNGEHQKYGLQN